MRIDELHKFSDGTLDDVRTALNDRLKGIRMEYLPQTFWSQRDKANARAMIQAIDKRLKTRRIMRSLERFVGGRPYGVGSGSRKFTKGKKVSRWRRDCAVVDDLKMLQDHKCPNNKFKEHDNPKVNDALQHIHQEKSHEKS
ncbi:hypothetical protein Tco_1384404 [Tanacetum coccineum]